MELKMFCNFMWSGVLWAGFIFLADPTGEAKGSPKFVDPTRFFPANFCFPPGKTCQRGTRCECKRMCLLVWLQSEWYGFGDCLGNDWGREDLQRYFFQYKQSGMAFFGPQLLKKGAFILDPDAHWIGRVQWWTGVTETFSTVYTLRWWWAS
jgi:hypothetical protein